MRNVPSKALAVKLSFASLNLISSRFVDLVSAYFNRTKLQSFKSVYVIMRCSAHASISVAGGSLAQNPRKCSSYTSHGNFKSIAACLDER